MNLIKHLPLVSTFAFRGRLLNWIVEVESNEFPIKLLYNVVCCCIKFCTVTLYSKCQFNQHKMCIRLSQIGFTLLSSTLTNKNTHTLFPFFQSKSLYALMCRETIALPLRGCKVDDTYFTDAAFIKNNDNIWPRGSTCDAMNEWQYDTFQAISCTKKCGA